MFRLGWHLGIRAGVYAFLWAAVGLSAARRADAGCHADERPVFGLQSLREATEDFSPGSMASVPARRPAFVPTPCPGETPRPTAPDSTPVPAAPGLVIVRGSQPVGTTLPNDDARFLPGVAGDRLDRPPRRPLPDARD